ncbi:MAG TPA: lytic transglycosylase domain-containing protein, partial [Tahibacter sp.]|uniref:lytic transglycosylase domain-containing protein n=1 Tax=Tahibacter sp. TaxID=2056211 RepID=UPI002C691749
TTAAAAPAAAPAISAPGQWQYREGTANAAPPDAAKTESPKVLRGAVYKISKSNGITEYTNIRPAGKRYQVLFTYISTCFACDVHSRVNFASTKLNRDAFRAEIAAAALEFGLDEALLRAVVHAESAFNPNALSNKGAQGLMQLMPGTADDLGVDNPFDATQNIRGGAQYLAQQLKTFQGDVRLATAAYNAGPGNVSKYGGVPPFDETQVYVSRVATLRDRYRQAN